MRPQRSAADYAAFFAVAAVLAKIAAGGLSARAAPNGNGPSPGAWLQTLAELTRKRESMRKRAADGLSTNRFQRAKQHFAGDANVHGIGPSDHRQQPETRRNSILRGWSDRSEPMLTIVTDDVGKHDLLYAPCSMEMYRLQHGSTEYHSNCYDNLCSAFRELGIEPEPLPSSLNFFMNADVAADGRLSLLAPRTRAGAAITVRAQMDLLIALTSCPASTCNAGGPIRPLGFEVFS